MSRICRLPQLQTIGAGVRNLSTKNFSHYPIPNKRTSEQVSSGHSAELLRQTQAKQTCLVFYLTLKMVLELALSACPRNRWCNV